LNKLKYIVICAFLFLCISPAIAQTNNNDEEKEKLLPLLFIDAGLGSTSYGLSGGVGLHVNPYSRFTIGIDYNKSEEIAFYGGGESASLTNYLIGVMDNSLKPRVILYIGAGKTEHQGIEETASSGGDPPGYRSVYTTTWGVTLKGQIFLLRGSYVGLSFHPVVNFNEHKTFGGATLNITFGLLENL